MAIFEKKNSEREAPSVPNGVRERIYQFLRGIESVPATAKSEKLQIVPIRLSGDAVARVPERTAYAFSHRWDVPDAYFDSEGRFLFSISGILGFDSENDQEKRIATDALSMAGISERKVAGANRWFYRSSHAAETEIPPFSDEAFELWNEAAFFEARLDLLRRLHYLRKGGKLPPLEDRTVSELVSTGSITLTELAEFRSLGGMDGKTFDTHKKALSALLPTQISDQKFRRPLRSRNVNSNVSAYVRPVDHGIGKTEIERLRSAGHLDAKNAEMALERLKFFEEWNAAIGKTVEDAMSKRQNLRDGVSVGGPVEKKGR